MPALCCQKRLLGAVMFRITFFLLALTSATHAQVMREDQSLQEQLVSESFKLSASSVSEHFVWQWRTTVTYTLKNDSGMNLYVGLMDQSASIGSCTEADEIRGALPKLPAPGQMFMSVPTSGGGNPLRPAF